MTRVRNGAAAGAGITIGPAPCLRLYRGASRGCRRPLRPLFSHESRRNVADHARHPGRRLRQAPVAAVAREHAQAVRARCWASSRPSSRPCMRVADRSLFARPVIATNDAYRFMAEQQAKEIGMEIDILVEPSRRDSGPAMAAAAAYARNQGAKAVLALASDHLVIGAEEFRAACREGLAAVAAGRHRHLRHPADRAQDRLRLYPAGQRAYRPGAEGRGLRREAQRPDGAALHLRGPAVEQRQLPVPARAAAVRDGALRARHGRGRRGSRRQGQEDRLDGVPRCRCLRQGAGQVDRLRRHGAHRQMLGGAGQVPLVRPRHLGRAARCRRGRQRGQRHRGAGRDRPCAQFLRPLRRAADRGDRRRGSRRGGDERRRAGRPSRQPPAAEGRRAAHVGRQAPRRHRARRDAPAVGQLPGHRPRRALPRQAADGQSQAASSACRATIAAPSIGSWSRARPRSRSTARS